jgi:hypothetical protein
MPKNFDPLIEELRTIIENSRKGRLPTTEEQRGASLFKELILSGGKAFPTVLEPLGDLPWFVPVNGTLEAWPELTPARRRNFLGAFKPLESEPFRRMRLSIARGLHKIDPSSALALIVSTLHSIRKESGFEPRDRQVVFSVLIGKSKPWLLQLDLASLKPPDAQLLALSAIECSIGANPPSVVAILRWAKPYQTLATLSEPLQQDFARIFKKWSSRWQKQLSPEELPPRIREKLAEKHSNTASESQQKPQRPASDARAQEPALPPREQTGQEHRRHSAKTPQPEPGRRDRSQRQKPEKQTQKYHKPIPDVAELLRHLQAHFNDLRDELQTVRKQLERAQPPQRQTNAHSMETGKELAALRDENARLSETVSQLRETLSELANENFNQAVSRKADTDEPLTDPVEQFKSLLSLRVGEQIVSFQTLNPDHRADGLPLLLDNILRTLQESGIDLSSIERPPPAPRKKF